jgi:chaperonin cofactor prefoldin
MDEKEIEEINWDLEKIERKLWMFRKTGDVSYLKKSAWLIQELIKKLDDVREGH